MPRREERCGGSSPRTSLAELKVRRVLGLDLVQPELATREPLDSRCGSGTRDLGAQTVDVVLELRALAAALVELQVQAENGHVDRHDAGEQNGEHDDPEDTATQDP